MFYDGFNFIKKLTIGKVVNYLKLKLSYTLSVLFRKPVMSGYPAIATIEPVNLCNLKCVECPVGNNSLTREKGSIDEKLYRAMIDDLAPNLMWLMLYFQGEPFLHKNLPELISYASGKKIYTVISTNGHYLSEMNAQRILDSGLDRIIISLDGADAETYSKYRQGGDYNTVLSGIKNLVNLKKQNHTCLPFIIIQCLLMKHTENQVDNLKILGKELGVDKVVFKTLQITDFKNNLNLLPDNMKLSRYKITGRKEVSIKKQVPNRCRRLWDTLVLLHNGTTVPCCFDKDAAFEMGKYPVNTITEIWKGTKFKRFRQQILNSRINIEMCCNCTEGSEKIWG